MDDANPSMDGIKVTVSTHHSRSMGTRRLAPRRGQEVATLHGRRRPAISRTDARGRRANAPWRVGSGEDVVAPTSGHRDIEGDDPPPQLKCRAARAFAARPGAIRDRRQRLRRRRARYADVRMSSVEDGAMALSESMDITSVRP